ncbi:UNVERIFIED_CONTAM: hypothetical protein GTU68_055155, partial [Idotea baltica]|nr:hypothetical protein [Idotea baltica]
MLGKLLFNDTRLSHDNTISCASCHNISEGGDDGQPVSTGINGSRGTLNAPTVLNSSLSIAQFWDGRAKNLSAQIKSPIHSPIEMGSSWEEIVSKLRNDQSLADRFQHAFRSEISPTTIKAAIVSYEEALITIDAPFDRYLTGEAEAISPKAIEGYRLFKSIGCISCHQGKTVGGNMFQQFGVLGSSGEYFDLANRSSKGRFNVTGRTVDLQRFKVPSLRNVERTAPYFHNGSVQNL